MIREIKAIVRHERLIDAVHALRQIPGMPGVTVSVVQGFGRGEAQGQSHGEDPFGETQFAKIETVVPVALVKQVIHAICQAVHTGRPGDGKVFVLPVEHVTRISTGEQDVQAI